MSIFDLGILGLDRLDLRLKLLDLRIECSAIFLALDAGGLLFGERLAPLQLASVALIIAGVVGLRAG